MKISCIVTVYNRLEYLRNALKCLNAQTQQIDELIITDDGSREDVYESIKDILPECKFKIKHIYQKDLGFRKARALNNAVRECEGELLIFIDQDVIFGKDYIKDVASNLKDGELAPLKVLWSSFEEKERIQQKLDSGKEYREMLQDISEEQKRDRAKQNKKDFWRSIKISLKLRKKGLTMGGASYALYRDSYLKVNGYDEEFKGHGNEDLDFGNRLQRAGVKAKIISPKEAPIHMCHPKDPTVGSNVKKYEVAQKENEIRCKHGYENGLDNDPYEVRVIK